jgi:DNA-binding SARP family transcriptional activator
MTTAYGILAGRLADWLIEARTELTDDEFEDILALAAAAIARSDLIERQWQDGRW